MKQPRDTKAALIYLHLVATGGTTAVEWRVNTGQVFPPSDWPQFLFHLSLCRVGNTHRVRMSASVCTNWHKIPTNTNKHTKQPKAASKSPQSGLKYLQTRRKCSKKGRKWKQTDAALANQIPQRHKRTKNITKRQKLIINSWENTKKDHKMNHLTSFNPRCALRAPQWCRKQR